MKKLLSVAVVAIIMLSSCTKDQKDKTTLLCEKDWKLNAWTMTYTIGSGTHTIDVFNDPASVELPECILDDLINFTTDGTFVTKPQGAQCNYVLVGSGDWKFRANEAVLWMQTYGDTVSHEYTIDLLDENACDLTTVETIGLTITQKTAQLAPGDYIDVTSKMSFTH